MAVRSEVIEIAPAIAYSVWRQYKNFVEKEDVTQELYAWAITREEYVNSVYDAEESERKHAEKKMWWQMRRVAERYCRKEKAAKSGYKIGDEYFFDSTVIAILLPAVIQAHIEDIPFEIGIELVDDGSPKKKPNPSEGGNLIASLVDVRKAYTKLPGKEQNLLKLRYLDNMTLEEIGTIMEVSKSTVDRRCENAIRHLIKYLGGITPWK